MSKKRDSSGLVFLHRKLDQSFKDGKSLTHDERILEGDKGMTIIYYKKANDKKLKITVRGKGDEFYMTIEENDSKNKIGPVTWAEMKKLIKDRKELDFASSFLKTQRGGEFLSRMVGGKKKSKKASSKKASKKASKKTSKKASKKSSKRRSKRKSKKSSK